jgi:indolepyruvate ferredoxin oxidoreductase
VKSSFAAGDLRFEFHLAPPLLAKVDPATGEPKKMSFGPWMLKAFAVLAKFKFLRGTPLDIFGYTEERRIERRLVTEYLEKLDMMMAELSPLNYATAVAIASIPEKIRGFGPIKLRTLAVAKAEETVLLEQFRSGGSPLLNAAE